MAERSFVEEVKKLRIGDGEVFSGEGILAVTKALLESGGVKGGALIIVGEDYGEGSSIMQERSHAFAMKSQIWMLDPRPNLPCIVQAVKDGFDLSEASNTPVMLQLRIRACHVHGQFVASDNKPAKFTLDLLPPPNLSALVGESLRPIAAYCRYLSLHHERGFVEVQGDSLYSTQPERIR